MSETTSWAVAAVAASVTVMFVTWYGNVSRNKNIEACIAAGGSWHRTDCLVLN